jgi:hypothetical protein
MWRIADRGLDGVFHCCGADALGRRDLALATARAWDLDPSLIRTGPPPAALMAGAPVPYDTSLSCSATAEALGLPALTVDEQLRRMRRQLETGALA